MRGLSWITLVVFLCAPHARADVTSSALGNVSAAASAATVIAREQDRERIVEIARRFLLQSLAPHFDRVDLRPVGRVAKLSDPGVPVQLQARLAPGSVGVSKRMCVWVDALADGVARRSVPVWFAVSAYKRVLVTETALAPRTRLGLRDLRIDERDVAALPSAPLTQYVDLSSLWLRRPLMAGAIVTQSDMEPIPAVQRDRDVVVNVVAGDIRIETRGTALKDGRVGDLIAVRAGASQEEYTAKVVGVDAVLVEEN